MLTLNICVQNVFENAVSKVAMAFILTNGAHVLEQLGLYDWSDQMTANRSAEISNVLLW